jgi:hypothetical protein
MTTIITSQAPDAKPVAISKELTDEFTVLVEVPDFEVPEESFGGGRVVVPGVAEIISPLLISNITAQTAQISIRLFRKETETFFFIANEVDIPGRDVVAVPLNGQFILTGDRLEVKADDDNKLQVTLSFTIGQAEQDDVV